MHNFALQIDLLIKDNNMLDLKVSEEKLKQNSKLGTLETILFNTGE